MIVLIGHVKGGVGKSTLALNIAVRRAREGHRVWLIDGDRRPSSIKAMTIRNDAGVEPGLMGSHYPEGKMLHTQLKLQADMFDDVIIDCGGQDSSTLRTALALADVLIIPNSISAVEVWALEEMHELLEQTLNIRDGLRIHCVLNNARPGFANGRNLAAQRAIKHFPLIPEEDLMIIDRDAFKDSFAAGLGVDEIKPKDPKAIAELTELMNLIFGVNNNG